MAARARPTVALVVVAVALALLVGVMLGAVL